MSREDGVRMKRFTDATGAHWVADALEERTPRHHGRWFLVFHPDQDAYRTMAMPEVRWQTYETADRTLQTMSVFELRRRLDVARRRYARPQP